MAVSAALVSRCAVSVALQLVQHIPEASLNYQKVPPGSTAVKDPEERTCDQDSKRRVWNREEVILSHPLFRKHLALLNGSVARFHSGSGGFRSWPNDLGAARWFLRVLFSPGYLWQSDVEPSFPAFPGYSGKHWATCRENEVSKKCEMPSFFSWLCIYLHTHETWFALDAASCSSDKRFWTWTGTQEQPKSFCTLQIHFFSKNLIYDMLEM